MVAALRICVGVQNAPLRRDLAVLRFVSLSCAARSSRRNRNPAPCSRREVSEGSVQLTHGPGDERSRANPRRLADVHGASEAHAAQPLTGRRACLRARSQRVPAAPTRAPPTSLYRVLRNYRLRRVYSRRARPKSHAAVPCGHRCACADCSAKIMERDRRCPYCREEVMMWMIPRDV